MRKKQTARKQSSTSSSKRKIVEDTEEDKKRYKRANFDYKAMYVVIAFNDVKFPQNISQDQTANHVLHWFNTDNRAYAVFGIENENIDPINPHIHIGVSYRTDATIDVYALIGVNFGYDLSLGHEGGFISKEQILHSVQHNIIMSQSFGNLFTEYLGEFNESSIYQVPNTYLDETGTDRIHIDWQIKLIQDMDSFATSGQFLF